MHNDRLMVKRENDFDYPIVFRTDFSGLKEETEALHKSYSSVCIVTDTNVAPLYLEETKAEFQKKFDHVSSFTIPAGEQNKHLDTVTDILRHLIVEGMDR
ncbi:MAG: 3-dehydroquinate synthase, partial [Lachnospiraceae bacterium]|nr:3-dehydroquinate synthase [Lachnospiraceae bacterium]